MLENTLATATHNQPASPPPDFSVILGELTDAITQAKAAAVTQAADRGTSSAALQSARTALFTEHLIPINTIAIGRLSAVPNVRKLFRLPHRAVHRTTLIKEATIIAQNAALYKDTFVASGLPADFIDQLNTAITTLTQVSDTRTNTRGDSQKATENLAAALRQGVQLVRGLNGIMQSAFAKNPDVLAAWNSARHIRRASTTGPVAASTGSGTTSTSSGTPSIPSATSAASTQPTTASTTAPSSDNATAASTPSTSTAPATATPLLHAA